MKVKIVKYVDTIINIKLNIIKNIIVNMKNKIKKLVTEWEHIPGPECKHPKDKVIKNELGWLCKGCMTYIDKDMITK
jgi:hypothetical protein